MSVNEIREKVYANVRDADRSFIEEGHVDLWIQEGMGDLSTRLNLGQSEKTGTTSGTISLPADFMEFISLVVDDEVPEFVDRETYRLWEEEGSPPKTIAQVFGGNIELFPAPSAVAYTLRYWSSSSDSLTEFHGGLRLRLTNYATYRALMKVRDYTGADRFLRMYESGLPSPNVRGRNQEAGPIQVTPILDGYFDSADYLG